MAGLPGREAVFLGDRLAEQRARGRVVAFRRDVQVSRAVVSQGRVIPGRGPVVGLSDKSRRRLALTARNVSGLTFLMTLTLPGEWLQLCPNGRALNRLWRRMRDALKGRGVGGLWFIEFQIRGAPHIHVGLNGDPGREWLAVTWARIVGAVGEELRRHLAVHRHPDTLEAIHTADGFAHYTAKYCAKWEQKMVPVFFEGVGRMWGLFGGVKAERVVIEGQLSGEVAQVQRVVRRLQVSRSAARDLRFKDRGVHGWTSYGVGPVIAEYLRWRAGLRPVGVLV